MHFDAWVDGLGLGLWWVFRILGVGRIAAWSREIKSIVKDIFIEFITL